MRLQRSIFKPRAKGTYRIQAKSEDEAVVYVYDEIGVFGIQAVEFVKDLNAMKSKTIHVRVNSPGGNVGDGMAIYNALKEHPSRIIAHIDGLAASISSVIPMAADEIHMAENTFLMIHEPWSIMIGGAEDFRREADLLDKVGGQIMAVYQARSGADDETVQDWMGEETWFTAEEALEANLIDQISKNKDAKATAGLFDLSVFAHTPETLLQSQKEPPTERCLEKVLRDAGCSRSQAKAILSHGIKPVQRDAEEGEPRDAEPDVMMDSVQALLAEFET